MTCVRITNLFSFLRNTFLKYRKGFKEIIIVVYKLTFLPQVGEAIKYFLNRSLYLHNSISMDFLLLHCKFPRISHSIAIHLHPNVTNYPFPVSHLSSNKKEVFVVKMYFIQSLSPESIREKNNGSLGIRASFTSQYLSRTR